jgi:hypothetical protein
MVADGAMVTGQCRSRRHRARGARSRRQHRAVFALTLALLCISHLARAAGNVELTAAVGFSDTFRPGHWTPLNVTATNHGSDVIGELEVQVTGGDDLVGRQFITSHRRDLELHRNSRKSLQFTVLPQGLSHPLVIRVRSGGRELARTVVDLRGRFAAERLLLVLSRNADLDYLNAGTANGLRVLYPHPELLPAHWRGYDAVAAVVVHGVSLERLSASQFDALHKWVAQGGTLAVSGGADYSLLRRPRLAALLPGAPLGMTRVDAGALQRAFSPTLDVSRPVHVNRVGAFRGHARLSAGDVALIVEHALGLGRVLYLTFDVAGYPFDRWDGMRGLLRDTLRLAPAATATTGAADAVTESPVHALARLESRNFPSFVAVFFFLALYLGVLLAGRRSSAREGRLRRLAPLLGWAAPVLFAPAAWLIFGPATFPRDPTALAVAVIEPLPDSPYARLKLDLGLYASRSGALRFEYRGAEPLLYPPRRALRAGNGNWILGEGPRRFLEPRDRRRYVLHAIEGEDVVAFRLGATVRDESEGPYVILDNASGRTVEDLWLVFDGYAYPLGNIADGARVERGLTRRAHGVEVGAASWRQVLKPPAREPAQDLKPTRVALERRSQEMGEAGDPGPGHALLVGYTPNPLQPAGASASWPRRERAVVAFQIAALPPVSGAGAATAAQ